MKSYTSLFWIIFVFSLVSIFGIFLYKWQGTTVFFTSPAVSQLLGTGIKTATIPSKNSAETCIFPALVHIAMYHFIRNPIATDAGVIRQLSTPVKTFDAHMAEVHKLANSGQISLLSMQELIHAKEKKCYPNKEVFVFTDDDGWLETYTALAPIARKYKIPFSFGIITSKLDAFGFLSTAEVQELAQDPLFEIASHSVHHEDQDTMGEDQEHIEICKSRKILESITKIQVNSYIFPAGRMSKNSSKILGECGYALAFTTGFGVPFSQSSNGFDINRMRIFPETKASYFEKVIARSQE